MKSTNGVKSSDKGAKQCSTLENKKKMGHNVENQKKEGVQRK